MKKYSARYFDRDKILSFVSGGFFICLLLLDNSDCIGQDVPNYIRFPAEFEQQEAVWFGWEKKDTAMQNTAATVISILQGKVPLKMVVESKVVLEQAIHFLAEKGIDLRQIEFILTPGDRFWIRDNGPIFLVDNKSRLAVADFQWSSYGYFDYLLKDRPELENKIKDARKMMMTVDESYLDQKVAVITGSAIVSSKLIIEGGALETNGKGVLLQCEQLTLQRNPGWTKKQIENEFRRTLNIQKVIWLKKGTAEDENSFASYRNYIFNGTGGHLDAFARFADANTILLGWVDKEDRKKHPLMNITHSRMEENLKILEKASDQDGNPFRIIKVPMPFIIEMDPKDPGIASSNKTGTESFFPVEGKLPNKKSKKVAVTSYLNYLITNELLINASYINHGTSIEHEERVKAIFREAFPDRKQVWIDVFPLNRNGGGIHCITQTQPALNPEAEPQTE